MHQGISAAATQPTAGPTPPAANRPTPVCDAILGFTDRFRRYLFAFAALLYLAGFNGVYRPEPDSALYMTIGRNLAEGRGYTYLGKIDAQAYPGFPYLLSALFNSFGTANLFIPHLVVLLLTGLTLVLTYTYFRLLTSRPMAVIVTLNCSLAYTLYLCAFQLRNDVPFLLGVMAFLTGYESLVRRSRRGDAVTGSPVRGLRNPVTPWILLCTGLAIAVEMRPTMWALVGAIVLAAIWTVSRGSVRKRYGISTLVVVLLAVAAFYALYPRRRPGHTTGQYEQVALVWLDSPGRFVERLFSPRTIETFSRNTLEAMFGHELGLGVNSLVALSLFALGLTLVRWRPLWFFYLAATIAMMLVMAEMDQPFQNGESAQLVPRHFLGALPLMIYLWWRCAIWLEQHLPPKPAAAAVIAMAFIALGLNLAKVGETIGRQRAYGHQTSRRNTDIVSIEQLGAAVHQLVPPNATIVVPHKRDRVFAFFSGRNTLEATPAVRFEKLHGPVYVIQQDEPTVADFLHHNKLTPATPLTTIPGRLDWRGHRQPDWTLSPVSRKPSTNPATRRSPIAAVYPPSGGR